MLLLALKVDRRYRPVGARARLARTVSLELGATGACGEMLGGSESLRLKAVTRSRGARGGVGEQILEVGRRRPRSFVDYISAAHDALASCQSGVMRAAMSAGVTPSVSTTASARSASKVAASRTTSRR